MKTKKKFLLIFLALVLIITAAFIFLVYNGNIRFNAGAAKKYDVLGVDVSEYQGDIDWKSLEAQGLDFAFIKASEGSGYVDKYFSRNFTGALNTEILAAPYHFFSFDSPALSQADNFTAALEGLSGNILPPVVDIELYGKHKSSPPEAAAVHGELNTLLDILEERFGTKPIIYTTQKAYALYIKDMYSDYPLWIRDVYFVPGEEKFGWLFWQYSDKGRLDGYSGVEKYIDMNVFAGSKSELEAMLVPLAAN